uniref:Uncharacterized protein n=1 Tax=Rhizophora mucronata TaxID=61149 RepID=A0A2P2Q308_RHIMU
MSSITLCSFGVIPNMRVIGIVWQVLIVENKKCLCKCCKWLEACPGSHIYRCNMIMVLVSIRDENYCYGNCWRCSVFCLDWSRQVLCVELIC